MARAPGAPTRPGPRCPASVWTCARGHPTTPDGCSRCCGTRGMREFLVLPDPFDAAAARRLWSSGGRSPTTRVWTARWSSATAGRLVGSAALRRAGGPVRRLLDRPGRPRPRLRGRGGAAARRLGFGRGAPRLRLACDVATWRPSGRPWPRVHLRGHLPLGVPGRQPRRPARAVRRLARFARLPSDPGAPTPGVPPSPRRRPDRRRAGPADDAARGRAGVRRDRGRGVAAVELRRCRPRSPTSPGPPRHSGLLWLVGREARFAMVDVATGAFAGELQLRRSGRRRSAAGLRRASPFPRAGLHHAGTAPADAVGVRGPTSRGSSSARRATTSPRSGSARAAGFEPDGVQARRLRNADGTFADEVCFALVNPRYR